MPQSDQGVTNDRYMVIPRTAIFLRRGDSFLLLKGAPAKRLWANKYNGLGGHLERGEFASFVSALAVAGNGRHCLGAFERGQFEPTPARKLE